MWFVFKIKQHVSYIYIIIIIIIIKIIYVLTWASFNGIEEIGFDFHVVCV